MGEYATYNGSRIKIGTCEDMMYLRPDQRYTISNSDTNMRDPGTLAVIRFRFPFPDEDGKAPGSFHDHARGVSLYDVPLPEDVKHGMVQFQSNYPSDGFLISLPCPEGPDGIKFENDGIVKFHRNGYPGAFRFEQVALRDGRWIVIGKCGGCGALFRVMDPDPLVAELRRKAARELEDLAGSTWHGRIADRIENLQEWCR